jgi:V8-like Glu-specific endopeptidase
LTKDGEEMGAKLILVLSVLFQLVSCGKIQNQQNQNPGIKLSGEVIYGGRRNGDNRSEAQIDEIIKVHSVSEEKAREWLRLTRSTAALVDKKIFHQINDGFEVEENLKTLGEYYDLCEGEEFIDQPVLSECTGFLISDKIMMTAGHCINEQNFQDKVWVFDYTKENTPDLRPYFPNKNVYFSQSILKRKKEKDGLDYAIVKLDRPVVNRASLKFRKKGKIKNWDKIFVIGHPHGMPSKIHGNAKVKKNNQRIYFLTNTDTSQGNSGSPVFNFKTNEVEGILVRGDKDWNESLSCNMANYISNREAKEGVIRITMALEDGQFL